MKDLKRFMDAVGASLADVSLVTGLDRSTVSRIRSGVGTQPRHDTVSRIKEWADALAKERKLPKAQWLDVSL